MSSKVRRGRPDAGFTLIEVLAAIAVTAALVAVVLPFAGRLATRWWIGETNIEAADGWMQAIARLSDDLSQALPLPIRHGDKTVAAFRTDPEFVEFVRTGLSAEPAHAIEAVRVSVRRSPKGEALVRQTRRYDPGTFMDGPSSRDEAVTLLDGPYRFQFSTIDAAHAIRSRWIDEGQLPAAVQMSVRVTARQPAPASPILLPVAARRLGGPP